MLNPESDLIPSRTSSASCSSKTSLRLHPPAMSPRPRQLSAVASSDEELHLTSPTSPAAPYSARRRSLDLPPRPGSRESQTDSMAGHGRSESPLPPPRPFFISEARNRASFSSQDSSVDPASTSDSDSPAPTAVSTPISPQRALPSQRGASSLRSAYHKQYAAFTDAGEAGAPTPPASTPAWTLRASRSATAPPSSFNFPAGAGVPIPVHPYNGPFNADPISRRSSVESLRATSSNGHGMLMMRSPPVSAAFMANSAMARASLSASELALPMVPYATRMNGASSPGQSRRSSQEYALYQQHQPIPRVPSMIREPFLSPASRSSSIWVPPTPSWAGYGIDGAPNGSGLMLAGKKEPLPSSALGRKLSTTDKPWIQEKDKWERLSWWATFLLLWLGVAASALVCYLGFRSVKTLPKTCLVFEDDFDTFDTQNKWHQEVELGGFGNGEFQMTTSSQNNSFVRNGQLYLLPTLTSDVIGRNAILDGGRFSLADCTSSNRTACNVTSSARLGSVINPVQSARITTQRSASIAFGKVEVRAKLPRGDWLWPAIWMLPVNNSYGGWPMSGEIDIMESRGNGPSYAAQGANFVRSSLNWGPLPALSAKVFGWQASKRTPFSAGFHTYTLEWDASFMRFSVDSRVRKMLDVRMSTDFFTRGGFPETAQNGSSQAVVRNPWAGAGNAAPFDKEFYLIIDLAVGGTSGWFPDNVGDKPWFDASASAMHDFAVKQDTWSSTWPTNEDDRAFRIDSVKMYKLC